MSFDDQNSYYDNDPSGRGSPTPMGRRGRRRNGWLGSVVAVLLLIVLTGSVVYLTFFAEIHIEPVDNGLLLYVGNHHGAALPSTDPAQPEPDADTDQAQTDTRAATAEAKPISNDTATKTEPDPAPAQTTEISISSSAQSPDTPFTTADGALSLQQIYQKCSPSVVSITTSTASGTSSGTGIVLSADGYLITNHHVIEDAAVIAVLTSDDAQYQAQIVGSDEASDLAVLKVEAEGLQPAEFGDSSQLRVGDSVVAIGDPLGTQLRGTMTSGIVSAINRDLEVNDRTMTLIQTDAALNNGNSGGPLINCYGQVIGINTMKLRSYYSSTAEGLGFAIPMSVAQPILEELLENGYVSGRPAIGISYDTLPAVFRIYYDLPEGVYVTAVYEGSDAKAKGVAAGDIITAVNGTAVRSIDELNRIKNQFSAGDPITLTLYSGGYTRDVTITLIDQATGQ